MEDKLLEELCADLNKAIINKDISALEEIISSEAEFFHFSEKPLSRDEYLSDIANELFKYYDFEIKHVEGNSIIMRIDAELYGSKRNWWIFCMVIETIIENDKLKIKRSQIVA